MAIFVLAFLINQGELYLVDQPVTRVFEHGTYEIALRFGPAGGVLGFIGVGLLDRFAFGLSVGASNLIGANDPEIYPYPGIQIKAQLFNGGMFYPEWALGFDNQGFGEYNNNRYLIKSKGFYTNVAKGFTFGAGEYYILAGLNYSLERRDGRSLDIFFGQELTIMEQFAFLVEYDPAFNDPLSRSGGYLNLSLRLFLAESVTFEFALRDIIGSGQEQMNRVIKLAYNGLF